MHGNKAFSSTWRIISAGYLLVIFLGTMLLWLPFSSKTEGSVRLADAFFTATSASCVTGLIRFDTYTGWTFFGQVVILILIQIGGIGFMTLAMNIMKASGFKIGLTPRIMMKDIIAAPNLGGMVRTTSFIIKGTAIVEGVGAFLLALYFVPRMGFESGIWFSIFHSISAFCNAGFDLFGRYSPGSSLTAYTGNWYVNLIIMLLIVIGGLGFFVWKDLIETRFRFNKFNLQTKLVVVTTLVLIFGGAIGIFSLESGNPKFNEMSMNEQILGSLFQSVTARTAGFNTYDLSKLTGASQFLMIVLMFVGGSNGSTAGGIKTTTAAIQLMSIRAIFQRRKSIEVFNRSISEDAVKKSACVLNLYLIFSGMVAMLITRIDAVPFWSAYFESVSAIGTVGVSLGITGSLSLASELLLSALMIFGRAGSLTILLSFSRKRKKVGMRYPVEKIQVG